MELCHLVMEKSWNFVATLKKQVVSQQRQVAFLCLCADICKHSTDYNRRDWRGTITIHDMERSLYHGWFNMLWCNTLPCCMVCTENFPRKICFLWINSKSWSLDPSLCVIYTIQPLPLDSILKKTMLFLYCYFPIKKSFLNVPNIQYEIFCNVVTLNTGIYTFYLLQFPGQSVTYRKERTQTARPPSISPNSKYSGISISW